MAETSTDETQKPEALGTESNNPDAATVAREEYDKALSKTQELEKELQKIELERNMQRNKAKEEERLKAESEKDYEKLFQIMKQETEDLKSKYEITVTSTATEKARAEALAGLPEKLQSAAKALLDKATSPEQVKEKAAEYETLAKELGFDLPANATRPEVLNPNPSKTTQQAPTKTLAEQGDDLHRRIMQAAGKKP